MIPFPRKLDIHPLDLKPEHVIKTSFDPKNLKSTFYCTAYADPHEGQSNDYSLIHYPPANIQADFNFGFININDLKSLGTFGNSSVDNYNIHVRDRVAIMQLAMAMKEDDRSIQVSYIDDPDCSWDDVHLTNFIRNTEGEVAKDKRVYTNNVQSRYLNSGRMMDAETSAEPAFAENIKASFLRGIELNPDTYRFIYCSYANRPIDAILNQPFSSKNFIEKRLLSLGFKCIADFITKRSPELSQIHTMSYGGDAQSMLAEGDTYAMMLAKGNKDNLYAMRKYVSIGLSPNITPLDIAKQVAPACDPNKKEGFRSFMVWAGNSPDGVTMYEQATALREKAVPDALQEAFTRRRDLSSDAPFPLVTEKTPGLRAQFSGNKDHFQKAAQYQLLYPSSQPGFLPGTDHSFRALLLRKREAARQQADLSEHGGAAVKQVTPSLGDIEQVSATPAFLPAATIALKAPPRPENIDRTWGDSIKSIVTLGFY